MRSLKVVSVGETQVGKTCLLHRIVHESFDENQGNTIGTGFLSKIVPTASGTVNLQLWDTAGQEQFRAIASMYYQNAHVALFVYDMTKPATFTALMRWWAGEVKKKAPGSIQIILVGNKSDIGTRSVSREEAREFAQRLNAIAYLETSAKTGAGVKELLQQVLSVPPDTRTHDVVVIPKSEQQQNASCC